MTAQIQQPKKYSAWVVILGIVADLTGVLTTRGPRAMLEEIPALESVMYRKEWVR